LVLERITIIGMSPVGASIGLALMRARLRNTEIIGTSVDRNSLTTAAKMGAMDKAVSRLRNAVEGAQLVIIDTPLTETRDALELVADTAPDGCVVTDTGAAKVRVLEWAKDALPPNVSFVGGHPLTKTPLASLDDASATAFEGVDYCLIPSANAEGEALRTVVGLVERLGAKPLFLDAKEHDSYAAAMTYLPIVLSSAFVTATTQAEGWREMHRLAASEFAEVSRYAGNDPLDNEVASRASPEELVHWLDKMIATLYSYRNQIKEDSDGLLDAFIKAWEARAKWEANAVVSSDSPGLPSAGDSMASAFLGDRLAKRMREISGGGKEDPKKKFQYLRRDRSSG
jgi:prephenate dehydrogenase